MRTAATSRWLFIWAALFPPSVCVAQAPVASPGGPSSQTAIDTARQLPLFATRQNVFSIPFTVDRRVAQPVEVHLFVSMDQGATWQLSSREPPAARQFSFRARGDGEYWFASRTLDANQRPPSPEPLRPELRVVVDTVPPKIECSAQALESGDVLVRWQAVDQYLLATSLKVEYQEAVGQPWKLVDVQHPDTDAVRSRYDSQTQWHPETRATAINVRVEIRDRAGNLAVVNRRVVLPSAAANNLGSSAIPNARLSDPFARPGQPSEGAVAWPSDNAPIAAAPAAGTPTPNIVPPVNTQPPPAMAANPSVTPRPATTPPGPAMPTGPVPPVTTMPPADNVQNQFASTRADAGPHIDPLPAEPGETPTSTPGQGNLPVGERPQITNAQRFQLEYDITAVGPDGVAEVQLWATADGGNTWRMWGTDEDKKSPFEVVAEQEGVFGFHVVVVGGNGLVSRRPRSGDLPDIWVAVDTTPPTAHLTGAVYGEGTNIGKLFLRWEANDVNLGERPITLQFAENPDGPWTVIASGLPNSGEYAWPADPQLPDRVYLRLEVRDAAGNTAVDQLKEPVELEGLAPKARIRGVLPLRDSDREAFRQPQRS